MDKIPFSSLGLSPEILQAVAALGFEEAAPIQAAAIPVLLAGKDVVGQSQTGSGKTAAFAIPAIELCDATNRAVQVLIMCPTRELATQVADEVHKLTAFKRGIHSVPIYGGASYERQFFELKKGVQIVIGTPGRIIDHLERGTLNLDGAKMVILDEADRMLDMGFRDDIQRILDAVPKERQTVFFSATLSQPIRELINRYAKDPQTLRIEQKEVTAPDIEQWVYEVPWRMKMETLIRLIDFHGFKLGIIFCNTQRMVDELADSLTAQGISADRLHGGIAQAQRTRVMDKFKKAEFEFLVATDVAARGIDVDALEVVVNYDLPYDAEDYVHRIGRTGRAGKRGMAVTFVSGRDVYKIQFIERFTKTKMRRGKTPTAGEVEEKRTDVLLDRVRKTLEGDKFRSHMPLLDRLLEEGLSSTDIAAGLFQLLIGNNKETKISPAKEAAAFAAKPERPVRAERPQRDERPQREERSERPAREHKKMERPPQPERHEAPARAQEEVSLRRAIPGMQWICVSVGRSHDAGPRDIVDLIADKTGLPGRNVGMIELTEKQAYAQVPESYVTQIQQRGRPVQWADEPVDMWPWQHTGSAGPAGPRKGKPFRK